VSDAPAKNSQASAPAREARGPVLDMLRGLLAEGKNESVVRLVAQVLARNTELEKRLAKRRMPAEAGNESEGISTAQLELLLQALQEETNAAVEQANQKLKEASKPPEQPEKPAKPPKQPALRRPPPANLRRVPNPISVPEAERPCPTCGKDRKCKGHDVTHVIELIPAEVIVREDMREVLVCTACEGELERAPLGDKVVSRGIYGSVLVGTMLVRKYDHGMPLHRQREELLRLGLDMPSASASDQIQWATDLLRPLWHQAQEDVLGAKLVQLDPTSLPVRDKEHGFGIQLGSLCAYIGDQETVVYLYASTGKKSGQRLGELGPEDFLSMRQGLTMADASNVFDKSFLRPGLIECGCNTHARRYFVRALESGDHRAALPIAAYKRIYDIEEQAAAFSNEDRKLMRLDKVRPICEELLSWCRQIRPHEPPQTPLAKACGYVINHHVALMRFLDDGAIPIDNSLVERLHRRPAIARRNSLFVGSHAGGERAAIAFSTLATCRLIGLNPVDYLADVLPTLARGVELDALPALMPKAWKQAHPNAAMPPLA
jgi:transposase